MSDKYIPVTIRSLDFRTKTGSFPSTKTCELEVELSHSRDLDVAELTSHLMIRLKEALDDFNDLAKYKYSKALVQATEEDAEE